MNCHPSRCHNIRSNFFNIGFAARGICCFAKNEEKQIPSTANPIRTRLLRSRGGRRDDSLRRNFVGSDATRNSRFAILRLSRRRGFTLIELMIVISIILILVSIAVPMYQQSVVRAKEAVLRQDLKTMRDQIDNYTMDKDKAPQALQDLVEAGYLRSIPKDPFTGTADTWQVENSDTLQSLDQTEPGISDVHSGSSQTGSDGQAYSSW